MHELIIAFIASCFDSVEVDWTLLRTVFSWIGSV